jgi:hypothetical protein
VDCSVRSLGKSLVCRGGSPAASGGKFHECQPIFSESNIPASIQECDAIVEQAAKPLQLERYDASRTALAELHHIDIMTRPQPCRSSPGWRADRMRPKFDFAPNGAPAKCSSRWPRRASPIRAGRGRIELRPATQLADLDITNQARLAGVTPHTLRHSFGSIAGDLGYPEAIIATLHGHASGTVTARYVHPLGHTIMAAADRVAARIGAYLDGTEIF